MPSILAAGGETMRKVIQCPCGVVIRADDDDALVEQAQRHARSTHNLELTPEQALALAHPDEG
jgi:predicted small metal-binding protein